MPKKSRNRRIAHARNDAVCTTMEEKQNDRRSQIFFCRIKIQTLRPDPTGVSMRDEVTETIGRCTPSPRCGETLSSLPPFHRLTLPCPFGAGAAGDARGGEVDHSKHDLLQVGLQATMGIFKLTFGVHLWQSIDTLEMGILLIQIHSRFALGPY